MAYSRSPRFRAPLLLVVWSLAAGTVASAQQVPTPPTPATIRVNLLPYDDSTESLRRLQLATETLPPRVVTLHPGGTISALILEHFGFGPSDLPATYALFEQAILLQNQIQSIDRVREGQLLVPGVPRRVRATVSGQEDQLPTVAQFSILARRPGVEMTTASVDDVITAAVVDTPRQRAAGVSFDVPLPENLLRDSRFMRLAAADFVSLPSEPLRVSFEQSPCLDPADTPVLSQGQRAKLAELLKAPRRSVPMYVIDVGWPSAAELKLSWEYLRSQTAIIRKRYHMTASPALPLPPYENASHAHSRMIDHALKEFRSINPDAVRVVYVPMSKEQGAGALLQELIEVADVVKRVRSRFPFRIPASIPKDILDGAREFAETATRNIPGKISGQVTETEKAIVESTIELAAEIAMHDKTFHVVNESWVVETNVIRYDQPGNPMGLIVAAAGNQNRNVNVDQVDFAQRSATNGYFVAVVNVDSNGNPTCLSSRVDDTVLSRANAVGFSGKIPGSSGTSFAAPRVAWLLAAAESIRPTDVQPGIWAPALGERLRRTRVGGATGLRSIVGDPIELLSLWLQ